MSLTFTEDELYIIRRGLIQLGITISSETMKYEASKILHKIQQHYSKKTPPKGVVIDATV
jgi:hypothetical protein